MPLQVVANHQDGDEESSIVRFDIQETAGACKVMPKLTAWLGGEVCRIGLVDDERLEAREQRALQAKEK